MVARHHDEPADLVAMIKIEMRSLGIFEPRMHSTPRTIIKEAKNLQTRISVLMSLQLPNVASSATPDTDLIAFETFQTYPAHLDFEDPFRSYKLFVCKT